MSIIEDGKGSGSTLRVGSDNRLHARVVAETESIHNTESGKSFNFNTGMISVTTDSSLMYFKNLDTDQFIITGIAIGAFDGITHADTPYITIVRNPIAGNLITDATDIAMNQNRNLGSASSAEANIYKGKNGGTLTGGDDLGIFLVNKTGRSFFTVDMILTKGSSIGIMLTTNETSGTANYYAAIIGYFKDNDDIQ